MPLLKRNTIVGDKYKVQSVLGAGGMGTVYLAEHKDYPEFKVALKVLSEDKADDKEWRDRMRNEVLAGYKVSHPNVVGIYELIDNEDLNGYAMEYVKGGSLYESLSSVTSKIDSVVSILKQIAQGLSALHKEGTVHRDLKPENVLLTEEGIVKLSDFGVAHVRGGPEIMTADVLAGTPRYLAPEYLLSGKVDHRGDLYALGVMAYEMLTGDSPWRAESIDDLVTEREERPLKDLFNDSSDSDPELSKIIAKLMSPLEERYQRADHLVAALETLQKHRQYSDPPAVAKLIEERAKKISPVKTLEVAADKKDSVLSAKEVKHV